MRFITSFLLVFSLSACSIIFPIPHDSDQFSLLVDTKIEVDKLDCSDKTPWEYVIQDVNKLAVYTQLREDPQAENISQLKDALVKAKDSNNVTFCEGILKVQKTRVDTVVNAWRGR